VYLHTRAVSDRVLAEIGDQQANGTRRLLREAHEMVDQSKMLATPEKR
jgi:hypothetical protein